MGQLGKQHSLVFSQTVAAQDDCDNDALQGHTAPLAGELSWHLKQEKYLRESPNLFVLLVLHPYSAKVWSALTESKLAQEGHFEPAIIIGSSVMPVSPNIVLDCVKRI